MIKSTICELFLRFESIVWPYWTSLPLCMASTTKDDFLRKKSRQKSSYNSIYPTSNKSIQFYIITNTMEAIHLVNASKTSSTYLIPKPAEANK